jgi:hypothetical protein
MPVTLEVRLATTPSWPAKANYNVITPNTDHLERMRPREKRWERIANQRIE